MATAAARAIVAAPARPIVVINGICTIVSAASAITTVPAAKTTALPAVESARRTASSNVFPSNR